MLVQSKSAHSLLIAHSVPTDPQTPHFQMRTGATHLRDQGARHLSLLLLVAAPVQGQGQVKQGLLQRLQYTRATRRGCCRVCAWAGVVRNS